MLGAAFAGLGGAIFAGLVGAIFPSSINLFVSINVAAIIIVGGMGSIPGVVVGALFLIGMPELFREFSEYRFLFYGLALMGMMLYRPEGLWPSGIARRELHVGDEAPAMIAGDTTPIPGERCHDRCSWPAPSPSGSAGCSRCNKLDFEVDQGAIVSVIGPNGAGKTTFFNCIAGFYAITSGEIELDGQPIHKLRRDQIAHLGVSRTYQNIRLFANMTAMENILVGQHQHLHSTVDRRSHRHGVGQARTRSAHRTRPGACCVISACSGKGDMLASKLPYGDQRRLEIGRALANKPRLLLLDEPTAGMNPTETAQMTDFIRNLRDELGITILLIEHEMRVVMGISERITVLDEEDGDPQLVAKVPDEVGQLGRLRGVHPRCRLVEQEQARLVGERPTNLEPALVAIWQLAREHVALAAQADITEQAAGLVLCALLVLLDRLRAEHCADPRRMEMVVLADQDVLHRGHVREQPDVLVCPGHAQVGDLVAAELVDRLAVELDLARCDGVEPGDAVEERRLPGAVRSDDADDGALIELEVELVHRQEPAEPLGDGACHEERHDIVPRVIGVVSPAIIAGASSPTCSSRRAMPDGQIPSGRYSIIPMSANP